jgi:hypothetical protein
MHLLLDLDPSSDPVSGWIGLAGSTPRTFIGYANLIAAVESLRAGESLDLAAGLEEPT